MFGSSYFEIGTGVVVLVLAGALWRFLLYAFRRQPAPVFLRSAMAAEVSTVLEIALLAFGGAYLIDGLAKAVS